MGPVCHNVGLPRNFRVLKFLYRAAEASVSVAGLTSIELEETESNIVNVDLTDSITGHTKYDDCLEEIMKVCLNPPAPGDAVSDDVEQPGAADTNQQPGAACDAPSGATGSASDVYASLTESQSEEKDDSAAVVDRKVVRRDPHPMFMHR